MNNKIFKKDVFISYSSKDIEWADEICKTLETESLNCWIAHRDINPGEDWAESINNAIKESSVFVLVFSQNSNQSVQVIKELTLAVNNKCIIIPFKVDSCHPTGSMEYYLSDTHWMLADNEKERALIDLKGVVFATINNKTHPSKNLFKKANEHKLNKKMDIAFISLFLAQILFGFIYNSCVLLNVKGEENTIFTYFIFVLLLPVTIMIAYMCSKRKIHIFNRFLIVFLGILSFIFIYRALAFKLQADIFISCIKNLVFILLIVPMYVSMLFKYYKAKYASIWLPLLVILYSILAFFICGVKFSFITMIALAFITIFCLVENIVTDKIEFKKESIKSIICVVAIMFLFFMVIVKMNPDMVLKFKAWMDLTKYANTSFIVDIMKKFEFINLNFDSVLNDANSIYSYTYLHILDAFGMLTLVVFLFAQLSCGVLLIIRSIREEKRYESIIGVLFGSLFILQMAFGFASSFGLMPLTNFGAPIITIKGFEYGFACALYYFRVILIEKKYNFGKIIIQKSAKYIKSIKMLNLKR